MLLCFQNLQKAAADNDPRFGNGDRTRRIPRVAKRYDSLQKRQCSRKLRNRKRLKTQNLTDIKRSQYSKTSAILHCRGFCANCEAISRYALWDEPYYKHP